MATVYVVTAGSGVRREVAGVPKIEVVGRSKEKVEELSWARLPRSGPTWREVRAEMTSTLSCGGWNEIARRFDFAALVRHAA